MKAIVTITTTVLLAVVGTLVVWPATASASRASEQPRAEVVVKGVIDQWVLEKDGSVVLLIEPSGADEVKTMTWFRTPASQTAATRFEEQVFDLIAAGIVADGQVQITIHGDGAAGQNGSSYADALDIVSIRSKF